MAKPIRITSIRRSGFLLHLKSNSLNDMSQIYSSYLAAAQLVKKFPAFYENGWFTIVFTTAPTGPYSEPDESSPKHSVDSMHEENKSCI
jgi:hypothetical protein